jgi:hypothetical protein
MMPHDISVPFFINPIPYQMPMDTFTIALGANVAVAVTLVCAVLVADPLTLVADPLTLVTVTVRVSDGVTLREAVLLRVALAVITAVRVRVAEKATVATTRRVALAVRV